MVDHYIGPSHGTTIRPRLSVQGGGRSWQPGLLRLTHPPSHIRRFLRKKLKFIQRAQNWRSILGTQTFFLPPTPTPR